MTSTRFPVLHVPARDIPIPAHLSPQAAAQLAQGTMSNPPWPDVADKQAWRDLVRRMDEIGGAGLAMMGQHVAASVEEIDARGARVHVVTPDDHDPADPRIYMEFHGGALLWGGGESCKAMGRISSAMVGAKTWAVDYRMAPDHPHPAPLDDCVAAYRALIETTDPANVIVGGASAGGNFAAATVLRARDEGLPLPAAVALMTPEIDLTESGDTFSTLLGVDTALTSRLMPANLVHADGADLRDPYLSPLFGDFSASKGGFPPTILFSGTRDLFLSNTVLMHRALRRAGVEAELHVFEAATHVMFMSGPEADDRTRELRAFLSRHWRRA